VDVKYHIIREHLLNGLITLEYVPTADNLADIFTKSLPRDKFIGKYLIRVFLSGLSRLWKNVLFMLKSMREKSRNDIL
jgi:hypothetical protein